MKVPPVFLMQAFLFLLCTHFFQIESLTCDKGFPKVVGGFYGDTKFTETDVFDDKLVAIGETFDYDICDAVPPSPQTARTIVIMYEGPQYQMKWAKSFTLECVFKQVRFGNDGKFLMTHNFDNNLMIFSTSDGSIIAKKKVSTQAYMYDNYVHRFILLSSATIIPESPDFALVINCCHNSNFNAQMIKFDPLSTGLMWQRVFFSQSQWISLDLTFGESEKIAYILVADDYNSMVKYSIAKLDLLTSEPIWNYGDYDGEHVLIGMLDKYYEASINFTTLIAVYGQEQIQFIKVTEDNSGILVFNKRYYVGTGGIFEPHGIKALNRDQAKVVIYEIITFEILILSVHFDNDTIIKEIKQYPLVYEHNSYLSFTSLGDIIFATQEKDIFQSLDKNRFHRPSFLYNQGQIISSDSSNSCMEYSTGFLMTNSLTDYGVLIENKFSSMFSDQSTTLITIIDWLPLLESTTDITDIIFAKTAGQCDNYCTYNEFHYKTTYQYKATKPKSFILPEFKLSDFCDTFTAPVDQSEITYELFWNSTESTFPSYFTFDSTQRKLSVSDQGPIEENYFVLKGTYAGGKYAIASILVEGLQNLTNLLPPIFEQPLQDQISTVYLNTQYMLKYFDPEDEDVTSNVYYFYNGKVSTIPSFISYTLTNTQELTFNFNPFDTSKIGSYKFGIGLSDDQNSTIYINYFNVKVEEMQPPKFIDESIFHDQSLRINHVLNMQTTANDQYDLPVKISYITQPKIIPFLTMESDQFIFSPTKFSHCGNFPITITLSNPFVKRDYNFILTVYNKAPYFIGNAIPKDVKLHLNEEILYSLPVFKDEEEHTVSINSITLPAFIKIQDTQYVIAPTDPLQVGTHLIQGMLFDGQLNSPSFSFKVTVLNDRPYFKSSLMDQTAILKEEVQYILPEAVDRESLPLKILVRMSKDQQPLPKFITLKERTFTFSPKSVKEKGEYDIQVLLTDMYTSPVFYYFKLKVLDPSEAIQKSKTQNKDQLKINKVIFRVIKVTRDQQLQLKFSSASQKGHQDILYKLTTEDLGIEIIQTLSGNKANVDYQISERVEDIMKIRLNFPDISKISTSIEPDILEIRTIQTVTVKKEGQVSMLEIGLKQIVYLPPQISSGSQQALEKIKSAINVASNAAFPIGLLLNFFMSICIQFLWGLLNDLSFLTISSMISISLPGIAQLIQASLLNFIYLDVLLTDKWFIPFLFPVEDNTSSSSQDSSRLLDEAINDSDDYTNGESNDIPLNDQFDESGFSSMILLKNLGSTTIYLGVILFGYVMILVTSFCKPNKISIWLRKKLMWNTGIRFVIQQYPPMLMSSLVNIQYLKYNEFGQAMSSVLSFCIIIAFPILLLSFLRILKNSSHQLNTLEFTEKYQDLVEGLNTRTTIGKYWNVLMLLRWLLTSLILVFLKESPSYQILLMLILSVLCQSLILYGNPLQSSIENRISLVNELMVSMYLYLMLSLLDFNSINQNRQLFGWLIVGVVFLSILMNLLKVIVQVCLVCKQRLNKVKCLDKFRVQNKALQKGPMLDKDVDFTPWQLNTNNNQLSQTSKTRADIVSHNSNNASNTFEIDGLNNNSFLNISHNMRAKNQANQACI